MPASETRHAVNCAHCEALDVAHTVATQLPRMFSEQLDVHEAAHDDEHVPLMALNTHVGFRTQPNDDAKDAHVEKHSNKPFCRANDIRAIRYTYI